MRYKGCKKENNSHVGMIMVKKGIQYSKEDLVKLFQKDWPELPKIDNYEQEKNTSVFDMGQYHVGISLMSIPIPQQEIEYPINTAEHWDNVKEEISLHKGHYVVFVTSMRSSFYDTKIILTKIIKSLCLHFNAIGVYWGASAQVISSNIYSAYCELLKENEYPIPIWVKITGYKKDNGNFYLYTVGLNEFNFKNIEIMDYKESFHNGCMFLIELSNYILTSGKEIKDGDTIGFSEDQKILIRCKKSDLKREEEVMSLIFE